MAQHEGWLKSKDIDLLQSDGLSSSQVKQGSNADYKALYNKVKDADLNSNPELLAEVEANCGAIWCSIWTGGCSTPPTRAKGKEYATGCVTIT